MATPCHPWHTNGNKDFHSDPIGRRFIDACKAIFPQKQETICVGWTGYPPEPKGNSEESSWCFDEIGRFYLVTGISEIPAIFQRYSEGDVLMGYLDERWSLLDHKKLDQVAIQIGIRY